MRKRFASIRRFFAELRRRNVYQVAGAYLVAGFVVLQLADLAAGAFALPGWFEPMVWTLCALGFPIALLLAWALEMTPEGVRATPEADAESSSEEGVRSATSPTRDLWIGGSVLALVLLGAWWLWGGPGSGDAADSAESTRSEIGERSIAVLPFDHLSSDQTSQTFARGVHDDLLARLSNISDLTVISRTSVEGYRDTNLPLPAIADSLGVRWVMEGGVQKAGDQIQVRAQLIDPRTDGHVWADDYQRRLTAQNLFSIQTEITNKIARSMEAHLTSGEETRVERRPTENLEAYRYYMQGRHHLRSVVEDEEALKDFRQALEQDSSFALAWAGLAAVSARLSDWENPPVADSLPVSPEEAAQRALRLAPDLGEAHASLGYVYYRNQKGPAALRQLEKALTLKPSDAQAHYWMGKLLAALGQPEGALSHQRRSVQLNPLAPEAQDELAQAYLYAGQYEKALRQARKARAVQEGYRTVTEDVALLHLRRGGEVFRGPGIGISEDSPANLGMRVQAELQEADTTGARDLFERLHEQSDPWDRAHAYAALGEVDAAFSALQTVDWAKAGSYRTSILRYLYPQSFGPLREDPRYDALVREVNRSWGLNPDGRIPEETGETETAENRSS